MRPALNLVRSVLKVRAKLLSDGRKTLLHRPQRHLRQDRRGQKMHVHPPEIPTHQTARGDKREHLVMARCRHARQRGEGIEKLLSLGQVTAGQLANDEVVRADLGLLKEFDERGISPAQMIHPDGGINEHRRLASGPRPPARNRFQTPLGPAQCRQAPPALTSNQRPKARMHNRRLLPKTAQLLRPHEQVIIDNHGGSHMHQYGAYMHIRQANKSTESRARMRGTPQRAHEGLRL